MYIYRKVNMGKAREGKERKKERNTEMKTNKTER